MKNMFGDSKLLHFIQWICRRFGLLVVLGSLVFLTTPYIVSQNYGSTDRNQNMIDRSHNPDEVIEEEFLVRNPKCQIVSRNPFDSSIINFIKKEKFEPCRTTELLTKVVKNSDGDVILKIDPTLANDYDQLSCCWTPIERPKPIKRTNPRIDFDLTQGSCTDFQKEVVIPESVEIVLVRCKTTETTWMMKAGRKMVYENVHSILRLNKVKERLKKNIKDNSTSNDGRKLSVLLIGLDNVSRMNFERSMPATKDYLKITGWTELKGYNKMADNTFPNLMAILTGLNLTQAYKICQPKKLLGLDNCPFIWHDFKNANYVTAYGEDATLISTFNYMKKGFFNEPTDFYLRPYLIATEKYLVPKRHLGSSHYCTGPEPSGDRILNFALDFAKNLIGTPYFGFFWINAMSHDDINGLTSLDERMLKYFEELEQAGILKDSMVVFLSDHGMRYGLLRETVQGWYEEKLPFNYIWVPKWFREKNPEGFKALRSNGNSLTSPFNIHQTLKDILTRAGGEVKQSESCPQCKSLFNETASEIGCEDVGIGYHWCACGVIANKSVSDEMANKAGTMIVKHIDDIAETYKDSKGRRICGNLRLKKVIKMNELLVFKNETKSKLFNYRHYLCQLQVSPGDGKFEATIRHYDDGNLTIIDEVNRISTYVKTAECLNVGAKEFCFCE